MVEPEITDAAFDQHDQGPAIARRPIKDTAELDITPMIDITFLLLIFFLVASTTGPQTAVELPPARYGKGVNDLTSVIVTVAERGGPGSALVYLGERVGGKLLPDDPTVQEEQITQAVQDGFNNGKLTVLLKAERGVLHRDVSRVAAAAGQVEGIRLHLAVLEIQ